MGLDMYFYKETYVKNSEHTPDEKKNKITIKQNGKVRKDIDVNRISLITEEVAYWRKFNALHKWFIVNCADSEDDCRKVEVDKSQLVELVDVLEKVKVSLDNSKKVYINVESGWFDGQKTFVDIEVFEDISVAEELFPTTSGFFFGNTEYGMYYYNDLVETLDIFKKLVEVDTHADYYYQASW